MATRQRQERERAERHQLIIDSARELAEAEGWAAVTTRRLSERVEYSQPVLYSHFASKEAIVAAVAVEGFGELAESMRRARAERTDDTATLRALAESYLDFARSHPEVYAAMFLRETVLVFADEKTLAPMKAAFGELRDAVQPLAAVRGDDPATFAEVIWAALHGLVTLDRAHRLRPALRDARLDLLIRQSTAA